MALFLGLYIGVGTFVVSHAFGTPIDPGRSLAAGAATYLVYMGITMSPIGGEWRLEDDSE